MPLAKTRSPVLRAAAAALALAACALVRAQGGPPTPDLPLDAATRTAAIERLAAGIAAHYVFPERGQAIAESLRGRLRAGAYDGLASTRPFSERVNEHLDAASGHDKHLRVFVEPEVLPPAGADGKLPEEDVINADTLGRIAYGIERIERLPFNIGYVELSMVPPADAVAPRYAAVMTLLADTRALVVDLRRNHGGDQEAVKLLCSYLFDGRTRLNDIFWRDGARTVEGWTVDQLAGPRYGGKRRVVVLTSGATFSAGEDIAYALKNTGRATLVGEATGGGAHPGDMYRLGDHFAAFIPNGRSISPVTHADWEGEGVKPDVSASADRALAEAQKLLLREFAAAEKDAGTRERLARRIGEL
jgi:hypothetical protein